MVLNFEEERNLMPFLFVKNYEVELMQMNKSLYHLYIESVKKTGGERRVCQMRIHENGLPLTLVENYSKNGQLLAETDARDIKTVEEQLQKISRTSFAGAYVCVPMHPLTTELTNIERLSPKLAGYLIKRFKSIGLEF
jgi:hypothetical protein|tara:strand:+ start:119 stop:532 length:414 start_codon:yes stop_codon:yes gene_type:complete